MRTYTLQEAALFLKIHPDTLRERAIKGTIPGAKIGKAWVFIEEDLAQYLRSKYAPYPVGVRQGLSEMKEVTCQSTKEVKRTGLGSEAQVVKRFANLLGLQTKN